jgi:hypothetical protein
MDYHHKQVGPAVFRFGILLFLIALAIMTAVLGEWAGAAITSIVALIVGTALFVFSQFTVEVTDEGLTALFGWGWPRRTLSWDETAAARIVKNSWWYGFGIRWFPGGTLWNVWGLDAVEFDLVKSGKLRIGTDEPERLLAAVSGKVATG